MSDSEKTRRASIHREAAYHAFRQKDLHSCCQHVTAMLEHDPLQWVAHWRIVTTAYRRTGQLSNLLGRLDNAITVHPEINLSGRYSGVSAALTEGRRQRAVQLGLPPLLVLPLPNTDGTMLHTALAAGLGIPPVRISLQHHLFDVAIPNWIADVVRKPALVGPHLPSSAENLEALSRGGVKKITVLVRDPRQAILSRAHHIAKHDANPDDTEWYSWFGEIPESYADWSLERQVDFCLRTEYQAFVDWITGWLQASRDFDIQFLTYERISDSLIDAGQSIVAFHGIDSKLFRPELVDLSKSDEVHFRLGSIDEWRDVFSLRQKEFVNDRLSDDLRQAFGWQR